METVLKARTGAASGPTPAKVSARGLARLHTQAATDVLASIMSDTGVTASVRARAARALLAFGHRRPAAGLASEGKKSLGTTAVSVEWARPPESDG